MWEINFLKTLNRMNDLIDSVKIKGNIKLDGENIYNKIDLIKLRKRVGMVFQKPNPFPMSIYDNVAYGPRAHGIKNKSELDEIVEKKLETSCNLGRSKRSSKKECFGYVWWATAKAMYSTCFSC